MTRTPDSTTRDVMVPGLLTLPEALTCAAEHHSNAGMYFTSSDDKNETTFQSYGALLDEATCTLQGLRAHCPTVAKPIVLLLEDPRNFLNAFWACVLGGYIPCPLAAIRNDQDRWTTQLDHIDKLLNHPLLVCEAGIQHELPRSISAVDITTLGRDSARSYQPSRPEPSDVAFLMLTSGSTGRSKAVALTHVNTLSSVAAKVEVRELTSHDIVFNWVAFDHVVALLEAHILSLCLGATQVHARPSDILADPLAFLRIMDRFRVTTSFTPNFLLGKINADIERIITSGSRGKLLELNLSCVRHILSGGEANLVDTGVQFLHLLAPYGLPQNALWPAYGMTETCAAAVYSKEFPARDRQNEFATVGLPVRGFEMRIVDENEQAVPETHTGNLEVRGPMVFDHYYNNKEATYVSFTESGWFRTGDTARVQDGCLSLVGRSKESVIVSGVNYFVQELEFALERLDGIERSFVAAFPTRPRRVDTEQLVVAFATAFPLSDIQRLNQLVIAVRNTTMMLWGFRPALIIPLPKHAFPKTNLGKIQRSLMRHRLELGEFSEHIALEKSATERQRGPYVVPNGSVEASLAEVFAKVIGVGTETVSATANFFDLGGTSLETLQLTRTLNQRFGLDASLTTVLQSPTIRGLAALIEQGNDRPSVPYDPLVPLQESGRRTPLFCIHPGDGGTFVFVNLAKYFVNARPVYALRPRGFNPREQCFQTFGEIVDTYVTAIQRVQPHGPYAIAGYSLGGSIAFEVARTLEARGHEVPFLGCIDGVPCGVEMPASFAAALVGAAQVLNLIDKRHFASWTRVATSLQDLSRSYSVQGAIAEMTVFTSAGLPPNIEAEDWRSLIYRWSEFVHRPRYVEVAGDHNSLLSPKHVASFQGLLHAELACKLGED